MKSTRRHCQVTSQGSERFTKQPDARKVQSRSTHHHYKATQFPLCLCSAVSALSDSIFPSWTSLLL